MLSPLRGSLGPLGVGRQAASATTPPMTDLRFWLKADAGLYDAVSGGGAVTADGASVARWEDQGGLGYHVSQSTAGNRAVLKTNIKNGLPVLRFNGSTQFYTNAVAIGNIIAAGQYTVLAVFKAVSISTRTDYQSPAIIADGSGWWGVNVGNTNAFYATNWPTYVYYTPITTSTFYIGVAYFGGGTLASVVNNGVAVTGASGNVGAVSNVMRVGRSATDHLNGDIGEILVYNVNLSGANRAAAMSYLNNRWAVY